MDAQPTTTDAGWSVLHLFCRADGPVDAGALTRVVKQADELGVEVVSVSLLGHKADVGFMVLSPQFQALRRFQTEVQSAGLVVYGSYVSLTELSEYASGLPEEMKAARLHPVLPPPDKPAFCFYPMSKRRNIERNWYALGFEERKELMLAHGKVGRQFHGRIVQVITGSTGLDDWEWGVTLFGTAPEDLKDCVYQMRFDPGSAHYAEFGPFWAGTVGSLEEVLADAVPERRLR